VAVALLMHYLGKNHAWCGGKIRNRVFKGKIYTHENTGAGHNFSSTNDKCESILKPHISLESRRMKTTKR